MPPAAEHRTALDRFLAAAARHPDNVAVTDGARSVTYAELLSLSRGVAGQLRRTGVRDGELVGLSVTRGWRVVVGIVAIWQCGGAYVPIDPSYPAHRREYIAQDARVTRCLVDGETGGLAVLVTGPGSPEAEAESPEPAYVIYTSGSTGRPKGVVVEHRNLAALLDSGDRVLRAGPEDVGTVLHSYCFDFSVWEIWRLLAVGGRCVFVPPEAVMRVEELADLLAEERVTLLNIVPSVFANLVHGLSARPVALPGLREVIFGGEAVDLAVVDAWWRLGCAPAAVLVNMYGITETTVHVTYRVLGAADVLNYRDGGTPIGKPLPHLRVAVLDPAGSPVAGGGIGELYISGDGVSAGYLRRSELTGERFVRRSGERWYRSGDLARIDGQGLVYLGRRDSQVQLRGHRIELAEVESVLRSVTGVSGAGAVVVANRMGEPVLVGCYVSAAPAGRVESALRGRLRERLPAYMIPSRLVSLAALPVTPEGKLDRAQLAVAVASPPTPKSSVAEPALPQGVLS